MESWCWGFSVIRGLFLLPKGRCRRFDHRAGSILSKNEWISFKRVPAAPGIAIGSAYIVDKQDVIVPPRAILDKEILLTRPFWRSLKTREQISSLKKKISDEVGSQHAQIFDAHLLVLEDRMLIEDVIKKSAQISNRRVCFSSVFKKYIKVFANIRMVLRERSSDVNDIARRVLRNLVDETRHTHELENSTEELIIIAHDLSPSDTAVCLIRMFLLCNGYWWTHFSYGDHGQITGRSSGCGVKGCDLAY